MWRPDGDGGPLQSQFFVPNFRNLLGLEIYILFAECIHDFNLNVYIQPNASKIKRSG